MSCDENVKINQLEALLSEKDEDLDKKSLSISRLREQLQELEESNQAYKRNHDSICEQLTEYQVENQSLKEMIEHLNDGLEQLARKYDEKSKESTGQKKETERLAKQLQCKMKALDAAREELEKVKELNLVMKKSVNSVIKNLTVGCGLVDSYVKQLLPKKESNIKEKIGDVVESQDEDIVYEGCAQALDIKEEYFDEEIESLYNQKRELPGPLFAELKSALVGRNPKNPEIDDNNLDSIDHCTLSLPNSSSCKINCNTPNQATAITAAFEAAKMSKDFKNAEEECFGDDESDDESR